MDLKIRHIGAYGDNPATLIDLTVEDFGGSTITETITNSNRLVDQNLINTLRNIADELEEHNQKITN